MDLINKIFLNEWVLIPLVTFLVFISVYMFAEKAYEFLKTKSLGKKDEIGKILSLMGTEMSDRKLALLMLLMSYGLGFIFFLILWPHYILGALVGIGITVGGWSLPYILVKSIYDKRCNQFVDQMVDGLTIMANGIKAGSNPQESMRRVVEIMGSPIRQEFSQVLYQMQVGDSFENALNDLGQRIPKADVQMFVTAINILKETGGNLSETFETIVSVIRERQKIEKKIQAMTAQGLMQGIIVTSIPFILLAVFFVIDPGFIKPMFTTTLGLVLLMVMLGLQVIGGIVIKKIVTIKV